MYRRRRHKRCSSETRFHEPRRPPTPPTACVLGWR